MLWVRVLLLLLPIAIAGCGSLTEPTGSYIYSEADGAMMLQITRNVEGRVDANFSIAKLEEDGKITAGARQMTGTYRDGSINLVGHSGESRTLISGLIDGKSAKLNFFVDGTSESVEFHKDDPRKFDELSSQLRTQAADRARTQQEVDFEKQRGTVRSDTQGKIDKAASAISAQAQEVGQAVKKLEATVAEHAAALAEIRRLETVASGIRGGTYDNDTKIRDIQAVIQDMKAGRSQSHSRVQSFSANLNTSVSEAQQQVEAFQIACSGDPLLECGTLNAALQSLKNAATRFATVHRREEVSYAALAPD